MYEEIERRIQTSIDNYIQTKINAFKQLFLNFIDNQFDNIALIALMVCVLLAMFNLKPPKTWIVWIVAIYIMVKFFRIAGDTL